MTFAARFSPCRTYRYRLERPGPDGREGPVLAFIMVNPARADEQRDDQTIRMCRLFGRRHGYGRVLVGNLFAYRAPDVRQLALAEDPVGPENDAELSAIIEASDRCYAAWGAEAKVPRAWRGRWREVADLADRLGRPLYCLAHLAGGHPRHPQILKYDDPDLLWRRPD